MFARHGLRVIDGEKGRIVWEAGLDWEHVGLAKRNSQLLWSASTGIPKNRSAAVSDERATGLLVRALAP
jgi:hypothetical protein